MCWFVIMGDLSPCPKEDFSTRPEAFRTGPPSCPVQGMISTLPWPHCLLPHSTTKSLRHWCFLVNPHIFSTALSKLDFKHSPELFCLAAISIACGHLCDESTVVLWLSIWLPEAPAAYVVVRFFRCGRDVSTEITGQHVLLLGDLLTRYNLGITFSCGRFLEGAHIRSEYLLHPKRRWWGDWVVFFYKSMSRMCNTPWAA